MTPYRFLGVSEVARFGSATRTHKSAWTRHWFSDEREADISAMACGSKHGATDLRWYRYGCSDEFLAIGSTARDTSALTAALLAADVRGAERDDPDSVSGQLALHLLCGAVADLVSRIVPLSGGLTVPRAAPEFGEAALKPYGGMVGLRIRMSELHDGLHVFLSAALTQRWMEHDGVRLSTRRTPVLAARTEAVARATVGLKVVLHDDALSVGDVRDLKAGDVILLSESIRQPLEVRSEAGLTVGECYLGRALDQRAIRLVKLSKGNKHV